jgi:hypothetical protein
MLKKWCSVWPQGPKALEAWTQGPGLPGASLGIVCGIGDLTQGLTRTRQALCHLSHTPSQPFFLCFSDRVSFFCLATILLPLRPT